MPSLGLDASQRATASIYSGRETLCTLSNEKTATSERWGWPPGASLIER